MTTPSSSMASGDGCGRGRPDIWNGGLRVWFVPPCFADGRGRRSATDLDFGRRGYSDAIPPGCGSAIGERGGLRLAATDAGLD